MFIDPISHHALRQPHTVAVALPNANVAYGELDGNVNCVAHHLRTLAPRGARVAIVVDNHFVHWSINLALGRLGAISVSIDPSKHEVLLDDLKPDLVLSDRPLAGAYEGRDVRVGLPWLKAVLEGGNRAPLPVPVTLDEPARIAMSSGTTGRPKKMLFTHGDILRRVKSGAFNDPGRFHERIMAIVGIDTLGGYVSVQRTWWAGGTVCMMRALPDAIVARRVTGIVASPQQIQGLLKRLPPDFSALPHLVIAIGGGRVAPNLSAAVRLRLTSQVSTNYGSTETGAVASAPMALLDRDPNLSGIVLPWVEIEAADANGKALPPGETGEIRIRTPEMIHEYLDDPEATAKYFRDGWFYPGDVGVVTHDGRLSVLGRVDDVANIGGVKIAPDVIEEALLRVPGVRDAGVFTTDGDGTTRLWAAIVEDGKVDLKEARETVDRKISLRAIQFGFIRVPSIPRNTMGKIERYQLRAHARKLWKGDAAEVKLN